MKNLPKTVPQPKRDLKVPEKALWLSGEGAGSWFFVEFIHSNKINMSRLSPEGDVECFGVFISEKEFPQHQKFSIGFPSHCAKVTLVVKGKEYSFKKFMG